MQEEMSKLFLEETHFPASIILGARKQAGTKENRIAVFRCIPGTTDLVDLGG